MGPDVGKIKNELLVSSYRQMKTEKNKNQIVFLSLKMIFLQILKCDKCKKRDLREIAFKVRELFGSSAFLRICFSIV